MEKIWNDSDILGKIFGYSTILGLVIAAAYGFLMYKVSDRISTLLEQKVEDQKNIIFDQTGNLERQNSLMNRQIEESKNLRLKLDAVEEENRKLSARTIEVERGRTFSYDFNGLRRSTVAGEIRAEMGEEIQEFVRILALYDQKEWRSLAEASEIMAAKFPKWLTPYLYGGVAHLNNGNVERAKELLQFVQKNAGSDPNYRQAGEILSRIR